MSDESKKMEQINRFVQGYHQQATTAEGLDFYQTSYGISAISVSRFKLGMVYEPLDSTHEQWVGQPCVPYKLALEGQYDRIRAAPFEFDQVGEFHRDLMIESDRVTLNGSLFNIENIMPSIGSSRLWVVDQIIDVIRLKQLGERAVAVPGYDSFKVRWMMLMASNDVHLVYGERSAEQMDALVPDLVKHGVQFKLLEVDGYIDHMINRHGADAVSNMAKRGTR